ACNYTFGPSPEEPAVPKLTQSVPSYRLHRPSGQAIVLLDGKMHYLGAWDSPASKDEYERLIGEWLANGRRSPAAGSTCDLTVAELAAAYWKHAKTYYVKPDGTPTTELDTLRQAIRCLKDRYGHTNVTDFGP